VKFGILVPFKVAHLMQVATLWKPFDTTKNWTVHYHTRQCTVQSADRWSRRKAGT